MKKTRIAKVKPIKPWPDSPGREKINLSLPVKDLYRISEVAAYLGIHERTVRLYIDHGKLMSEKPAGTVYVTRESLLNFRMLGRRE